MYPLTVLKPTSLHILKHLPAKAQKAVADFEARFPHGELDFFVINHVADDYLPDKCDSAVRLNYVTHSYIFYNSKGITDDKAFGKILR